MEPIDLSDFFTTKAEADDFLSQLTTLAEMFFRTNFNFENALTQQLGVTKADRFLAVMRANNVNPASLPTVKEFVSVLIQKITTMPFITLTVAFEPNKQVLKSVSEWFVVNTKKQMLFDIRIDRTLIAGATINYQGKFSDFSIRETFNQVLKTTLNQPTQSAQPVPQTTANQHTHATVQSHPVPPQSTVANPPHTIQSHAETPTQQATQQQKN